MELKCCRTFTLLQLLALVFASTSAQPTLEPVDGGANRACRGAGPSDSPNYYQAYEFVANLALCTDLCDAAGSELCQGLEYNPSLERCEVWTTEIAASIASGGYHCLRAVWPTSTTTSMTTLTTTTSTLTSTITTTNTTYTATVTTMTSTTTMITTASSTATTTSASITLTKTSTTATWRDTSKSIAGSATTTLESIENRSNTSTTLSMSLTTSLFISSLQDKLPEPFNASDCWDNLRCPEFPLSSFLATNLRRCPDGWEPVDDLETCQHLAKMTPWSFKTQNVSDGICSWCVDCSDHTFTFSPFLGDHAKIVCKAMANTSTSQTTATTTNTFAARDATTATTFTTTPKGTSTASTASMQVVTRASTVSTTATVSSGSFNSTAHAIDISSELVQLHTREDQENSMLLATLSGDAKKTATLSDGSTMIGQKLDSEALSAGFLEVEVQGLNGPATVRLPESFLEAVDGDGALVITVMNSQMRTGTTAAVSIRAASASRGWVSVQGLKEPIYFTLPVEAESAHCAYWDEEKEKWSDEGMTTLGADSEGMLSCSSIHLTLFAAILDGFISALLCSKATLLSSEGLASIFRGNWFWRTDAVLLWLVLLLELGLILVAACLDMHRHRQGLWTDEHFLTCNASYVRQASVMTVQRHDTQTSPVSRSGTMAVVHSATGAMHGAGVAATSGCCSSAKETFMNFIDVLGSTFYSSFGHLRNFLVCAYEALCELVSNDDDEEEEEKRGSGFTQNMLSRLVAASVQHQACATLWLSREDVRFLAEERRSHFADEESGGLTPAARRVFSYYNEGRTPTSAWQDRFGHKSSMALDHISSLHQAVDEDLERHHSQLAEQGCSRFPSTAWKLFRSQAPWLTVLHYSMFMPASLSALLLMCRTFGVLAVTALFFQETGASSADSSELCATEGIWNSLGQCAAIGLASVLLAAIPEVLFARLHTREFIHFDCEDLPERKQQLESWRRKDLCLWTLCPAYIALCLLFVMSFLANVMSEDGMSWKVGSLIELSTELVFVPLATSLFFLTVTSMTAHSKTIVEESGKHIGFKKSKSQISSSKTIETQSKAPLALPGLLTSQSAVKPESSDNFSNVELVRSSSAQSHGSNFLE